MSVFTVQNLLRYFWKLFQILGPQQLLYCFERKRLLTAFLSIFINKWKCQYFPICTWTTIADKMFGRKWRTRLKLSRTRKRYIMIERYCWCFFSGEETGRRSYIYIQFSVFLYFPTSLYFVKLKSFGNFWGNSYTKFLH